MGRLLWGNVNLIFSRAMEECVAVGLTAFSEAFMDGWKDGWDVLYHQGWRTGIWLVNHVYLQDNDISVPASLL